MTVLHAGDTKGVLREIVYQKATKLTVIIDDQNVFHVVTPRHHSNEFCLASRIAARDFKCITAGAALLQLKRRLSASASETQFAPP